MKTPEEILNNYSKDYQDFRSYSTDDVIIAMNEYANQSKWISTETMPEFDGKYLCFVEGSQECGNIWKYHKVIDCVFNTWVLLHNETVTHWQPLPQKP